MSFIWARWPYCEGRQTLQLGTFVAQMYLHNYIWSAFVILTAFIRHFSINKFKRRNTCIHTYIMSLLISFQTSEIIHHFIATILFRMTQTDRPHRAIMKNDWWKFKCWQYIQYGWLLGSSCWEYMCSRGGMNSLIRRSCSGYTDLFCK